MCGSVGFYFCFYYYYDNFIDNWKTLNFDKMLQ